MIAEALLGQGLEVGTLGGDQNAQDLVDLPLIA